MPRKRGSTPSSSESGELASKARVRFVFEPDRSSPNGITYSWLIHKTYNGKEKVAIATRAFWLPFAYQETSNYSEAELRELAQQSIWQMEAQIQHLREAFHLGAPGRLAPSREVPQSTRPSAIATLPPITTSLKSEASQSLLSDNSLESEEMLSEFADAV